MERAKALCPLCDIPLDITKQLTVHQFQVLLKPLIWATHFYLALMKQSF
jgi:hypothetical protein